METIVVDIYDCGVSVSDGHHILTDSESCALIESYNSIIVGEAAKQLAHLRPREISTVFWGSLSTSSKTKHVVSNAELAYKHLDQVWTKLNKQNYEVILAIPNNLSKQDLGLLLGICEKLSIPVIGIVSKAVLALQGLTDECFITYLDILQNQIVFTEIVQQESTVAASYNNLVLEKGVQQHVESLAKLISEKFIAETRFDPLHAAEHEQKFYDEIPNWLVKLDSNPSITCTIKSDTNDFSIEIHKKHIINECQDLFIEITRNLILHSRGQKNLLIVCSPTCGRIFGLTDYLASLPGCAVQFSSHIVLANQALACEKQIRTADNQVHYTNSLNLDEEQQKLIVKFNSGTLLDVNQWPTHVLINHHAVPLTKNVFIERNSDGEISVSLDCNNNCLCKISRNKLSVNVEKLNDSNLSINGAQLNRRQSVKIGDRLNIENKNELLFISVTI